MSNQNDNEMFDLGSEPTESGFDPFATDDELVSGAAEETKVPEGQQTLELEPITEQPATEPSANTPAKAAAKAPKADPKAEAAALEEKAPVFEYAGASEDISDTSITFDELRISKSEDFPELQDGKRVSWTVEYGKITKTVVDPKGTSVGKMKSDIEKSKEFATSLAKAKDKNPACKVKPRVTAQSKGTESPYKGVFPNLEEAALAGKVISIIPARDGLVYEMRRTPMGRFITPVVGCEMLSAVRAGFVPALPRIPSDLLVKIVTFFRSYMSDDFEREVLVNIYWDALNAEYVVDAPEQIVSKASVNSQTNADFESDRYIHFMDVHSHNSMKAFFSVIDDKDEKATRLYTVIGNLHEYFPDIKTRFSNGGKFWNIDPGEVFELVAVPFPDEWTSKVRFRDAHDGKASEGFKWPPEMDGV